MATDAPDLTDPDILAWWKQTTAYRRLCQEARTEQVSAHRAALDKLAKLQAEQEQAVLIAREAEREGERAVREAESELAAAREALAHARTARLDAARRYAPQIRKAEQAVRTAADERIARFIAKLDREIDATRRVPIRVVRGAGFFDPIRELITGHEITQSNAPPLEARVAALQAAREQAEALKYKAVDDLAAELARIRDAIPTNVDPVAVE